MHVIKPNQQPPPSPPPHLPKLNLSVTKNRGVKLSHIDNCLPHVTNPPLFYAVFAQFHLAGALILSLPSSLFSTIPPFPHDACPCLSSSKKRTTSGTISIFPTTTITFLKTHLRPSLWSLASLYWTSIDRKTLKKARFEFIIQSRRQCLNQS